MAAAGKLGHGPCPYSSCGAPGAVFHRSSGGKLKHSCSRCDRSGYADQGSKGERDMLATIAPDESAPASSAPAAPAPAPRATTLLG